MPQTLRRQKATSTRPTRRRCRTRWSVHPPSPIVPVVDVPTCCKCRRRAAARAAGSLHHSGRRRTHRAGLRTRLQTGNLLPPFFQCTVGRSERSPKNLSEVQKNRPGRRKGALQSFKHITVTRKFRKGTMPAWVAHPPSCGPHHSYTGWTSTTTSASITSTCPGTEQASWASSTASSGTPGRSPPATGSFSVLMFSTFEHSVDILYHHAIRKRKEDCSRIQQLCVTCMAGYISGAAGTVISNHADNIVSALYNKKADNALQAVRSIGLINLFTRSLPVRFTLVGPLITLQWFFYDTIKVSTGLPTSGGTSDD